MSRRKRKTRYAVGRLLNDYLERSDRTPEEIADAAEVSRTNLYNWIAGTQANAIGIALLQIELGIPAERMTEALIAEHAERLRDASAEQASSDGAPSALRERLEQEGRQDTAGPTRTRRGDEHG